MTCLLFYECEANYYQLKGDIKIGCANAYVREYGKTGDISLFISDFSNNVRKGMLKYRREAEELIDFEQRFTFSGKEIRVSRPEDGTLYDRISRKAAALKETGIEEEEINLLLSMEVERTFDKYRKALIQDVTDKKQLEILVEEKLINIVEAFLQKAKEQLKRNFSPSVLYGLCLHLNAVITGKREKSAPDKESIAEILVYHRAEYLLSEELAEQIRALKGMKEMAAIYGFDISEPAKNAKEAFQWLYFGYLAAIKTQNGAAMSVGRISTFLDIYIERDLKNGVITEKEAQELVDHMVMKFRMVKFARIESYNQLFSGDPVWATLEVAGIGVDGRHMVTKNDYRFLHTLEDMGPAPEPNLTVLYSSRLPENFKKYAANISVTTSSIQYENDDVMRPVWGDDYSICCCVSATETGKEMQFFGARANLAKCLLYAINGGVDEKLKTQVGPEYKPITSEYLDYDEVMQKYDQMMDWLAHLYVGTLNMIHYMHDKYYYEAAEMALIDTKVERSFATGIAGFSHVVDSLSAIKYAKVKAIRDEDGITTDFQVEGDFPRYGNDDDRADEIATTLLSTFLEKLKHIHTYRDSKPTTSILTITSNVVYGKATGSLPDGRKAGEPLAPGANPSYGAEQNGLLASLNSVAKLDYEDALDGISNTQTINPDALGHSDDERSENLVHVLDGYFDQGAHHLNVNVFGKEKLIDAMEHPEKEEYANFTIRVSGYAVKFIDLTREQQLDVIARTCHDRM